MKTPLPFQVEGARLMASRPRVYNGDQPGLGKTLQTLLAIRALGNPRTAVLGPAVSRSVWKRESDEEQVPLAFVESYDRFVRNASVREELKRLDPTVIVLDEAHMLATLGSKRTREVLLWARHAPIVLPLSGTPMRSGPFGMFPILAACFPEQLRGRGITSAEAFLNRFTSWSEHPRWGVQVRGLKNVEEFKQMWQAIGFRRLAADVLPQLPPIFWQDVYLDPAAPLDELNTADVLGVDLALDADMLEAVANLPESATIRRKIGEMKAPLSAGIIAADLEAGADKVFVLAYHTAVLDTLERELGQYGVLRVDGSTTPRERETREVLFQTRPQHRVFLGQIVATQMSITLTAANTVHVVEPTWVPDDNEQAVKRIHRIGQLRPCFAKVHTLAGTIDERVNKVLMRKARMRDAVLGAQAVARV